MKVTLANRSPVAPATSRVAASDMKAKIENEADKEVFVMRPSAYKEAGDAVAGHWKQAKLLAGQTVQEQSAYVQSVLAQAQRIIDASGLREAGAKTLCLYLPGGGAHGEPEDLEWVWRTAVVLRYFDKWVGLGSLAEHKDCLARYNTPHGPFGSLFIGSLDTTRARAQGHLAVGSEEQLANCMVVEIDLTTKAPRLVGSVIDLAAGVPRSHSWP